jgi:alkylation response protein AidB-like acyl-CoA dehydrogenase
MDFSPSSEQTLLSDTARRFLEHELGEAAERYGDASMPTKTLRNLLQSIAPMGYLGSRIATEEGGRGLDFVSVMLLYEELFRIFPSLGAAAFVNDVVAFAIHRDGTEAQRREYLPGLISGELIACQAATEPEVGSNVGAIRMKAVRHGEDYRLSGRKVWITNGDHADICIVVARTGGPGPGGLSRLIVERQPAGFTSRELPTLGQQGCSTAELVFDQTQVPASHLLGGEGAGLANTLADFEATRCYAAIGAVGIANAALEAATRYAQEREQWGRVIAGHQLVQALIADMATELDAARLLTLRASDMVSRGQRCEAEAAMAKYYATEAGVRITSNAIQVHGALGLSRDLPIERYFRDARMMTIPDGTSQIQALIIGRQRLGGAAFGEAGGG